MTIRACPVTRRYDQAVTEWLQSSFCAGGDCLLVRRDLNGEIRFRDSRHRGTLPVPGDAFRAFLDAAKAGEFDSLLDYEFAPPRVIGLIK